MGATRTFFNFVQERGAVSPHFRSDHDAVTMGTLIVVLIAVAVHCSETRCDTPPAAIIVQPADRGFSMGPTNDSHVTDEGFSPRSPSKLTKIQKESRTSLEASNEVNRRKARLLGGLAFLAGLSFGGLATAASSTVKTIAKMPQASFILNLGPSKASPYFAAYYTPYSFLPYPLLYHGPFASSTADPSKPQVSHHDASPPQVISVSVNREPTTEDFAEKNDEYEEKDPDDDKSADGAEDRPELRADRNAEEKVVIRGCKEGQRKHDSFSKGSAKEREDLQVDADHSAAALKATNMTADANQTVTRDRTTTPRPHYYVPKPTQPPTNIGHHAERPHFSGYYGGYSQDLSHVDLTSGSAEYHVPDHGPINYNLPYEQSANFYRDDAYSSHRVNPYFPGSFSSDQINGYVGTDFGPVYPSEYHPPYGGGFKPVK
ncbi:PREDICTED: uncharacterized protein LOC106748154 [Dinoponera quadriceps]|uniref:Uncharacterized protein LOC106748154 n=1 Tax=Dinoponera quadriceps TaxID=609295 RepID=A0A6P3XTP8_DINQU|nr:PREDICTED: uncharacterized protein LOC106748154 [Dinoponera quadriceps]